MLDVRLRRSVPNSGISILKLQASVLPNKRAGVEQIETSGSRR